MAWDSYKLENFVQKFSDCIFNFQEKVDDVLSYTDRIEDMVYSLETCEYKAGLFKDVLEKIQKLVDDLNLRSYSNLVAWVGHLDGKVGGTLTLVELNLSILYCLNLLWSN